MMDSTADQIWNEIVTLLTEYGLDAVGAIVVLIVGLWASGWAKRLTYRAATKIEQVDETLGVFFSSMARYLVLALTVIMVLNQFGVQTASLIAVLGAAGLAIGLAMQGTLSNVAAGVMLLLFRPINVGQFVETGGVMDIVKGVNLFTTELATLDNVQIIVPNSQVFGSTITNYNVYDTRRIDLVMSISYGDSIDEAMATLRDTCSADDRVLGDPEPTMFVTALAASSVDITVRLWCASADFLGAQDRSHQGLQGGTRRQGHRDPIPAERHAHAAGRLSYT